jgi:hypothetical protein
VLLGVVSLGLKGNMWLASKSDVACLELEFPQINAWGEFIWILLDWVEIKRKGGWGRTTTAAETFIPLNTIFIPSPSLKVPFRAVEVTEMMKPFWVVCWDCVKLEELVTLAWVCNVIFAWSVMLSPYLGSGVRS